MEHPFVRADHRLFTVLCVFLAGCGEAPAEPPDPAMDHDASAARLEDAAAASVHDAGPPAGECAADADCDDGDACNGEERCEESACVAGLPPACEASDACHLASCDPASGCVESLIDADGDGHAPAELGECGDDCDDTRAAARPGATEVCGNALDDDCDGDADEDAAPYWADCDGDGVAVVGARSVESCSTPPEGTTGCPAGSPAPGWTSVSPVALADCDDQSALRSPMLTEIVGDEIDNDCDSRETCFVDDDGDGWRPDATSIMASTDLDCRDTDEARADEPVGDCDDQSSLVYPGAPEIPSNGRDESCDRLELCYDDGDRDGARRTTTHTSTSLSCSGPTDGRASDPIDCCDTDARAYPGQTGYFMTQNACSSWDYDCDGAAERRDTIHGTCSLGGGSVPVCGGPSDVWYGTSTPDCGRSAQWLLSCSGYGSCTVSTSSRTQACH